MTKTLIEQNVKTRVKGEARKKVQKPATLDENGAEVLDPNPLFLDAGFRQPETLNDKIRRITMQVHAETAAKFAAQNMTDEEIARILDEEDDFEVPDEFQQIMTQYEARGMVQQLLDDVRLETHAEPLVPEGNADSPPPDEGT